MTYWRRTYQHAIYGYQQGVYAILAPNAQVIRFEQSLWRNTETKEELFWCERAAQYVSQLALSIAGIDALANETPRPHAHAVT